MSAKTIGLLHGVTGVRRFALFLLLLVANVSLAADLRVHLRASPAARRCIADARVIARTDADEVRARIAPGATSTMLAVRDGASSTLHAVAEECWSETAEVSPQDAD